MDKPTPVEEDNVEKIINDLADFYSAGLNRLFNLFEKKAQELENNDINKSCHKDVEEERQPDGTKFHCLYLHKDHVLFLDWLLNHTREHTNMLYSLKLAHEIKDATSAVCRKIELEEDIERNRMEKKPKPIFTCAKCGQNCMKIEGGFMQVGCDLSRSHSCHIMYCV